jgi:hypothetical protein
LKTEDDEEDENEGLDFSSRVVPPTPLKIRLA